MALIVNSTSIPSSGKVIYNSASLKQVNFGSTKVWNSGIDLIAANNWTKTSSQDGFWGSSTSQLWLRAQYRTDWWNWIIVRSAALNLIGYTQITLQWDNNGVSGPNWKGFAGFSTNANLTQNDWNTTHMTEVLDTEVQGASGTKTFTIPSQFRRSGVYFYAERHFYKANGTNEYLRFYKIQIS